MIRSDAHGVDVGFPEKHRACPCPDAMSRSASVYTDTTLIAARARDAIATGLAPTAPTTAASADQVRARDAKPISDPGERLLFITHVMIIARMMSAF